MNGVRPQSHLAVSRTLLLLVVAGLCGCGSNGDSNGIPPNNPPAKALASIAVQPAHNKLAAGKTQQFTAIGTYTDGSTSSNLGSLLSWSSSTPSAAAITPGGTATALAAGQTTITAVLGNVSGTTTLTVPATTLVSLAITPASPTIATGAAQQFAATGAYSDGTFQALTSAVTWRSSDKSKASITPDGKATADAAGSTTITATLGSTSASTVLNVSPATLQSIAVTPSNPVIAAGTAQQFIAIGAYSDGTSQDLTSVVTWNSTDASKASIAADGKASAIAAGPTAIVATQGSISANTTLNVTAATLASILVMPSNPVVAAGTTLQFIATGTYSDNTTQDLTSQVSWGSSAGSVASITQDGKATAVGTGSATITATLGSTSVDISLNVTGATVTGTWEGTYTIYDGLDPAQLGTYTFKLVLSQSGTSSVTGSSALRFDTIGQIGVNGLIREANVAGRQVDFVFTYIDPAYSGELVNIGTATITDTSMTGDVIENYSGGYNCSYIFSLKKL